MRYFIELSYNGTNYHGWQKQLNSNSVQEELTKCLSILLKEEVEIIGAGRTDSGVHAEQMFAHFDTDISIDSEKLVPQLNSFLPNETILCNWCHLWDECTAKVGSNPAKPAD